MLYKLTKVNVNFIINVQYFIIKKYLKNNQHHYNGKKSLILLLLKNIKILSNKRKLLGIRINFFKFFIIQKLFFFKEFLYYKQNNFYKFIVDSSMQVRLLKKGSIHPLTYSIKKLKSICINLGMKQIFGNDIDSEWYNFTALNIPYNHPARQMHDTFYLKHNNMLLRTHTSTVQIHYMKKKKPPFKIFSLGKVYRSDFDKTHTPMFHQLEILVIDEKSSIHDMYCLITYLLKIFFINIKYKLRIRYSYFPFTKPSFEIDIFLKKNKKILYINNWLEIIGCGLVNKKILNNVSINYQKFKGYAIGLGIDRLTMLKYNISDLRNFYTGDIRWNRYYGY